MLHGYVCLGSACQDFHAALQSCCRKLTGDGVMQALQVIFSPSSSFFGSCGSGFSLRGTIFSLANTFTREFEIRSHTLT